MGGRAIFANLLFPIVCLLLDSWYFQTNSCCLDTNQQCPWPRDAEDVERLPCSGKKMINTAIRIFRFSFPYQPEKFPWPKRDIPRQLCRKWYPTRNDPIFPTFSAFLLKIKNFSILAPKIRASNWYHIGFQPISLKKQNLQKPLYFYQKTNKYYVKK